jgi:hypothetical protein
VAGGDIFEALGLIVLAFMLGTGGYLFLTRPRVTNAEARARLFGEMAATRKTGGEGLHRAAANTRTNDIAHRDGASNR